jgi:hypothetical protein
MASPALTPARLMSRALMQDDDRSAGTKKLPEALTRPRPFMNGGLGHPVIAKHLRSTGHRQAMTMSPESVTGGECP